MDDNKEKKPTPDFNQLELDVLNYWDENKTFEKSLEQTINNKPFVFYDGPPFATGLPHYGHILVSVIKDSVARYQTMKGHYVRRVWGWDCHGLPIENIVEQKLGISGKKQIEELGVDKFNEECRNSVLKYVDEWGKTVRRIGRWTEFENSYKTMDTSYMESVWWGLKEMWDKELIYEDRKVLLYCPRCETPISNFEVAMDNSYRDVTENSVFAKFKLLPRQRIIDQLTDDKTFILAWTTTPWTLPGHTALHLGPDIKYVMVSQNGSSSAEVSNSAKATSDESADKEKYILAKDRLEILQGEYEIIDEFPSRSLEGLSYEPPFPGFVNNESSRAHKVYIDDFVTTEDGTGVVHSAVMHGDVDFQAAKAHGLPLTPTLDHKGQFLESAPEFLKGVFFKNAEKLILDDLESRGLVYRIEPFTHSYPHCWRCGTALYYNAIPAWFISIQKVKPELERLNQQQINWYPDHLKQGRFGKGLETAPDWNISRNRYWATPLPFWKCENKECKNVECVGSIVELNKKATNFNEVYPNVEKIDLHRPYIDKVILKCDRCSSNMHRIVEVIDCWVESGSMPFAELHAPFENRDEFEKRYPADFVVEYIAQTRAWFYVMHVVGTIVKGTAPFKNVVTTGNILAEDGSKMSKSKNNYPDPWIVMEKYGVDAVRFYLLTSSVMSGDDFNFSETGVSEINRKVNLLLYNVWSFYRTYTEAKISDSEVPNAEHVLDKWALEKINEISKRVTESLDAYNYVRAGKTLVDWISDLSTWYVRRSRERLKENNDSAKEGLKVYGYLLVETAKLLAPFMPFLAEYIYRDVTGKESVHLVGWNSNLREVDKANLSAMELVREIVSVGHALRKEHKLTVRQPLQSVAYNIKSLEASLSPEHTAIMLEELNVKDVQPFENLSKKSGAVSSISVGNVSQVVLDTELNEDLKREGRARELERQVQDLRKKSGLKVGELVDLYYNTADEELEKAMLQSFDRTKTFVNQINKSLEVEADFEIQAEIGGKAVWLGLVKV